jgi:hypothetical protein
VQAFYGVASHTNNPGLLDIKGWQSMTVTQAAQAVQRSAYPDAYAQWEPLAREIVSKVGASAAPAPPSPTPSPSPSPAGGDCAPLENPHSHVGRDASGSCEHCFNPQLKFVVEKLKCAFPPIGKACGTYPSSSSTSDHPGNAADCEPTGNPIGMCPDATEKAAGWEAAKWLRKHATALGISYVIFDAKIWSRAHDSEGWRQYNGYSQGGCTTANRVVTDGHYDHIHISMYPSLV